MHNEKEHSKITVTEKACVISDVLNKIALSACCHQDHEVKAFQVSLSKKRNGKITKMTEKTLNRIVSNDSKYINDEKFQVDTKILIINIPD